MSVYNTNNVTSVIAFGVLARLWVKRKIFLSLAMWIPNLICARLTKRRLEEVFDFKNL